jgi:hypothetical protein
MRPREDSSFRLLVEGTDDVHSVIQLMARHGFDWDDQRVTRPYVSNSGGLEELLSALPVALKGRYDRIGVLVDANTHLEARWAQLRDCANTVGVSLPEMPDNHGTVVAGLRPRSRVGVWLMPDNRISGRLEDFLGRLVPEHDPVWDYAGKAVAEARRQGARCRESAHLKCRLHTWLAWQETPGLPYGTAVKAKLFSHDTQEALTFVTWFHRLFVEPAT